MSIAILALPFLLSFATLAEANGDISLYACRVLSDAKAATFNLKFFQANQVLAAELSPLPIAKFPKSTVTFSEVFIRTVPVPATNDGEPHPKGDVAHFVSSGEMDVEGEKLSFSDLWVHPKGDLSAMQPTIKYGTERVVADCKLIANGDKGNRGQ